MDATNQSSLELWGGVECTINRVADAFFSQLERTGHWNRLDDLDRFAELGIRTLRFPILWEDLAPVSLDSIAWEKIDAPLARLRELGIRPIAGLVHHGSGPRYTSLIDPEFPVKLATFARLVAERYPWLDAFTPVNEPLTTARFSGLYGHWYPHGHDGFTFARALLNQCRGVALAMRAIRQVNPSAALIQTDDLGKTYSRSHLRYQADFENDRRWITWDLLCGRVDRAHPMWSYFEWIGVEPESVDIFREEPCPPDIVGVNYYITSERFLDDHLRDHPPETSGGNGRHRYADVAAVRVRAEGIAGPEAILREACQRYGLPVAVTEAHLGCTREEQLRWFKEVWDAARAVQKEGFDVRGVTAWSLLGAYDWNSLLTSQDGHYEPGVFDLRGARPRATAIAKMIGKLSRGDAVAHPVLETPGWWQRSVRFLDHAVEEEGAARAECLPPSNIGPVLRSWRQAAATAVRPLLITGGAGRLAHGFVAAAKLRGFSFRVLSRRELDIASPAAVDEILRAVKPWAVINCAGFSRVDEAEGKEQECLRSNVDGAEILARACSGKATPLVTFSSDFVFDGSASAAYAESGATAALNVYGESKLLAEEKVRATFGDALLIRPGKLFAAFGGSDSLREDLLALARGERRLAANDTRFSLAYLPDLVNATVDLLIDGERGVWHLAHADSVTSEELLKTVASHAQLDTSLIHGVPSWSLHHAALRPRNRALRSERGQLLPPLTDALHRYLRDSLPLPRRARVLAM